MKVKVKCTKCNWEAIVDVQASPLGAMQPDDKAKGAGIKIRWTKDQLDKIMDAAGGPGASRDELSELGIKISIPQWREAEERRKLRRFLKEHLKICKEARRQKGEKHQVSTALWEMGDSWKNVDLASSEVKAMGVDEMRMIPGVTLQKRVYETTKGQDKEVLRGIKFFNIIDVSGSMFSGSGYSRTSTTRLEKVHKALMMAEETYKICKKLGYEYYLALFSDKGERVPQNRIKEFFRSELERQKYRAWNGGTTLRVALELFDLKELKDGNVVIMSDMDIADFSSAQEKLVEISKVTNSFKVICIEHVVNLDDERIRKTQELFPGKKVEILRIPIK